MNKEELSALVKSCNHVEEMKRVNGISRLCDESSSMTEGSATVKCP